MNIQFHLKTISMLVGLSLISVGTVQADQLQDIMSRKETNLLEYVHATA